MLNFVKLIRTGKWVELEKLSNIRPYLELIRLHKPTGIFLLLWPCYCGIAIAAQSASDFIYLIPFTIGAILMRSAGCVANDIIDHKFDSKVERTKNRPIASGELSVKQAIYLLVGLLLVSLVILLSLNQTTQLLGLASVIPVMIYPLMKRWTHWPQLALGIVFNWGVLMGSCAVLGYIPITAYLLYGGAIFWTIGYDTIYAMQDKEDDVKIGVKSTALLFGDEANKYVQQFYFIALALWGFASGVSGMNVLFYIGYIYLWYSLWYKQVQTITPTIENGKDGTTKMVMPQNIDYGKIFNSNNLVGLILFVSIAAGKL
jgi:4-hydroxybenzoate polyprenyltransferase